jgi:hypothetical protein
MKLSDVLEEKQEGITESNLKLSSIKDRNPPDEMMNNIKGVAVGVPTAAALAYGLWKSKIPQNIGKGAEALGSGIANLPKVVNVNKGTNFAEQIRKAFIEAHTEKVNQFGGEINKLTAKYPNNTVDLSELLSDLQTNPDISKQTLSVLKKVPKMGSLMENPQLASTVPLRDAQSIVNYLQTKIPREIRIKDFDLLDTINTIKGKQLESFPELAGARGEYRAFIEPYKNVKQFFKFNRLLNAIKNKFGGAEGQAAVEKILPKEVIKKMGGYRSAARLAELPQDIPLVGRTLKSLGGMLSIYPSISGALHYQKQMEEAKKKGAYRIGAFGEITPLSPEDLMI